MKEETARDLIDRLRRVTREPVAAERDARVSASAYTSRERFEAERAIFRRVPLALAHASEVAETGAFVTREVAGVPVVIVRAAEGLRAFVNVCRHRGTRLVDAERGRAKAFACRYHAWTYDLRGALTHVPHRATFPTLEPSSRGLVALPCEERHGIVWVALEPTASMDLGAHLGPEIDDDLSGFALHDHVRVESVTQRRACNWKLVIEAFLEGYHAKFLHAKTIARFFIDGALVVDRFGRNVRSAGGRRDLAKADTIRDAATLFYFIFPNTVLVLHPDWISHITMFPESEATSTYVHTMLVPRAAATDESRAHWHETWNLIEGAVFQKEDLVVADSIQASLSAGFERDFVIGGLELPIRYFHDALEG
ncbi:MAG TPA: aromatic ring-hydroxylating dioxygenase subunit alpha [Polyangiaceae bacterium]|jgi:phenylpropionate dioxygenase-like ring-hydroxylating dioxygenase large terminal subunit